jgi:hypothetical protein
MRRPLQNLGRSIVHRKILKDEWWWTESRANRSPPNFPANREIYREKLADASKVSAREAVYLAELGIFIRPVGNQLLHRPGNYFRCIRQSFSLHQAIAVFPDLPVGSEVRSPSQSLEEIANVI